MRAGLIGRKLGMTQTFSEQGERLPVTVLQMGPCPVVAKRSQETDGYNAVQIGFEEKKPSRVSKPEKGYFAKANIPPQRLLKEFRVDNPEAYEVGQQLSVDLFAVGQLVDVTGRSIGKGFAGVMKRWGFKGGKASHGAHKVHRSPGSIGQRQTPGRVMPGKKMAGHMGDRNVTVQSLRVTAVDTEKNLLIVHGSVPGAEGSVVLVRDAVKEGEQS
ncbi:MAG: 50S ribosomal protein L3 [Magnetococcales bacterium]|nr:50S ribosomal protein L3 [Magnetococcales bacterium]